MSSEAQRFRGGLVVKAHRRCVPLNSRLGSNKEEEEEAHHLSAPILHDSLVNLQDLRVQRGSLVGLLGVSESDLIEKEFQFKTLMQ